jgi:sec-independent protein translocase protein TatB
MLPETGAFELIFLAAIALIVVGPKDLPILFRKLGQFISKMRGLASEFRASFDELARQSELDELRKEVEALRNMQPSAPSIAHEIEAEFQKTQYEGYSDFQNSIAPQPVGEAPMLDHVAPVDDPADAYPAPKPKRVRKPKAVAEPVAGTEPVTEPGPKPKRSRKSNGSSATEPAE